MDLSILYIFPVWVMVSWQTSAALPAFYSSGINWNWMQQELANVVQSPSVQRHNYRQGDSLELQIVLSSRLILVISFLKSSKKQVSATQNSNQSLHFFQSLWFLYKRRWIFVGYIFSFFHNFLSLLDHNFDQKVLAVYWPIFSLVPLQSNISVLTLHALF